MRGECDYHFIIIGANYLIYETDCKIMIINCIRRNRRSNYVCGSLIY